MTTTDPIVAHARERIEKGSKSFAGAARLFDTPTRDSATMLYAWCRHCDDEIDGQELGFKREAGAAEATAAGECALSPLERLERLERQTRAALSGEAEEAVFIALKRVVEKHEIPHIHPLELLEGFRMDVTERTYAQTSETLEYCYHVAGVVGVMMAMIMGARARDTLNRASDLGIAFQLTNIARDVVPDAHEGRVYLPADLLALEGLPATAAAVRDPANREAVFRTTQRLLDIAEPYYASAVFGLSDLPFRAAWAVGAAAKVYGAIGSVVRARGARAWDTRAIVSKNGKLAGVAMAAGLAAHARTFRRLRSAPPRPAALWTHPGLGAA